MKVFTCIAVASIFSSFGTTAIAAPRKVVAENFTATWCTYCPDVANGLIMLQDEFPDTFFAMQVHGGDSYTTNWGNIRQSFYSVPGYPTVWSDGTEKIEGSYGSPSANYNILRSQYLARQAVATDVTMNMCGESVDNDTYTVSVEVGIEDGGTSKSMLIHCAQVIHNYPATPSFNYACFMQALNEERAVSAGSSSVIEFTFDFDSASMAHLNDVSFIAWAQATNTSGPSEVYQAEKHVYLSGDCQIDEFIVGATGDFPTITEAINACGTGDSILVQPGTYYENIHFGGKGISIQSTDGAEMTVISGIDDISVVFLTGEPTQTSVLDGFTIQNGNSPLGGGIYTDGSPVIKNCIVKNNTAQYGGGAYISNMGANSMTVMNTMFCGNTPDDIVGPWEDGGGNVFADGCATSCPSDINDDTVVDVSDILAVIDAWGSADSSADINTDGIVNVEDLLEVVGSWGPC